MSRSGRHCMDARPNLVDYLLALKRNRGIKAVSAYVAIQKSPRMLGSY
jgi:hypothetical protein